MKQKRNILFYVSLLLLLLLPGLSFSQSIDASLTSLASPYKKIVREYTGVGKTYNLNDLTTTYKFYATLHTPKFVDAVQNYVKKLYPNGAPPQAEKYLAQMKTPGQTSFFISLYARARGLKRMGEADADLWQTTLKVGEKSFSPIEVEHVPLTPFQYRFYPYVDKWYFAYRLVFPYDLSQSANQEITLQLSSVGGVSEVRFKDSL